MYCHLRLHRVCCETGNNTKTWYCGARLVGNDKAVILKKSYKVQDVRSVLGVGTSYKQQAIIPMSGSKVNAGGLSSVAGDPNTLVCCNYVSVPSTRTHSCFPIFFCLGQPPAHSDVCARAAYGVAQRPYVLLRVDSGQHDEERVCKGVASRRFVLWSDKLHAVVWITDASITHFQHCSRWMFACR